MGRRVRSDPVGDILKQGRSLWLDYSRRSLVTSGELARLIEEDQLGGVTDDSSVMRKVIQGSSDYDQAIRDSIEAGLTDVSLLFERLVVEDAQLTADSFLSVYEATDGIDGYVSLHLPGVVVQDAEAYVKRARRLWRAIDRPNAMLGVPATTDGVLAAETLVAEGINVNMTSIFSVSQYERAVDAYMRGLEGNSDPCRVASVASISLSSIDNVVDRALEQVGSPKALQLRGKTALGIAGVIYKRFKELFVGKQWKLLAGRGARVQRILWSDTTTRNPVNRDLFYVESLIGSQTVIAVHPTVLNQIKDHGQVVSTLEKGHSETEELFSQLDEVGIGLEAAADELLAGSADALTRSSEKMTFAVEEKREALMLDKADIELAELGGSELRTAKLLDHWKDIAFLRRLWKRDEALWLRKPAGDFALGWLELPLTMRRQVEVLVSFANEVRSEGTRFIVLLGMGGSSLAPEVYQSIFGSAKSYPELIVLDSTHPAAIEAVESRINIGRTLFLVSSKSGTTIETLSLLEYFWDRLGSSHKDRGSRFVAITDPCTPLLDLARRRRFREVFVAPPDVVGRYSAFTIFGMLPAALVGIDIGRLLDQASIMSENCAFCVDPRRASGLQLAAAMTELARRGRDKLTFLASPSLEKYPPWLEQLVAESTGKNGKGIVPVVDEPILPPESYASDRVFVHLSCEQDQSPELGQIARSLKRLGHPVMGMSFSDKYDIGQDMFRWQLAASATCAAFKVHPFNQPDVELSKDLARQVMAMAEGGSSEAEPEETVTVGDSHELSEALKAWSTLAEERDYVGIHAFLPPTLEVGEALCETRLGLMNRLKLATTLGYGPRFLHSTGQLHKGGPNTGLFIQLVDEPPKDLQVPKTRYTFGDLIRAQAIGDYQALRQLGRRVLRIDLKRDSIDNLVQLNRLLSD